MKFKNIIPWILTFLIFVGIFLFLNDILPQAKLSVNAVCFPEKYDNKSIITLGETVKKINPETKKSEIILKIYSKDIKVLKHELCHVHQMNRKITYRYDCEGFGIFGFYGMEIECYSTQELPNWLWEKIYGYDLGKYQSSIPA